MPTWKMADIMMESFQSDYPRRHERFCLMIADGECTEAEALQNLGFDWRMFRA